MTPEDKRTRMDAIVARTRQFSRKVGRRPRILIARTAASDTDREMKGRSAVLADMGFDVDIYGPLRSAPEAARTALENDVHAIGVVGAGAGRNAFLRDLILALAGLDAQGVLVTAWWRPTHADEGFGGEDPPAGAIIFDPDDKKNEAAERILDILESRP